MLYRTLGRTGERVSAIGLGGLHIGFASQSDEDSIRIIRTAIDRGITFMDNCWDYNDGASEMRMGKALQRRLPRQGLPDDQDRRPHEEGGGATDRRVAAAAADRPHRPACSITR